MARYLIFSSWGVRSPAYPRFRRLWVDDPKLYPLCDIPDKIRIYVCISASVDGISLGPRNTVVVAGSSTTFTCVTDSASDELCWGREGEHGIVCNEYGCRDGYSAHSSTENGHHFHSLTIDSCQATYTDRYDCHQCELQTKKIAHLVVLGTF